MEFNNFPAVLTVDRYERAGKIFFFKTKGLAAFRYGLNKKKNSFLFLQTFEDFFPTGVFITSVCGIVLVYIRTRLYSKATAAIHNPRRKLTNYMYTWRSSFCVCLGLTF